MSAPPAEELVSPEAGADALVLRRLLGAKLAAPLKIGQRAIYAVVLPSRTAHDYLTASLRGEQQPEPDMIEVLGADLALTPPMPRPGSVPSLAWVPRDGGLLSNLNVWENIELPVTYHWPDAAGELPAVVSAIMLDLGLNASDICGRRPVELNYLQRRIVAFVRAVAMVPKLLILDATFDDLEGDELRLAQRMLEVFVHALPLRTLLHLGTKRFDQGGFAKPGPIIVEVH